MNYIFENELIEGIIKKKNSQYTVTVSLFGDEYKCYWPCDTKLNISYKNTACLVSVSKSLQRQTAYTVEAIWIDHQWVGINPKNSKHCMDLLEFKDCKVDLHTSFDLDLLKSRKSRELFISDIEKLASNREKIIYLNVYQYECEFEELKWNDEQMYRLEEASYKGIEIWSASFTFKKDRISLYSVKKLVE